MFVVIAVVADAGPRAATPQGIATFVTPTIFHFCAALMISAIVSAPWPRHLELEIALALVGLGGFSYSIFILRWARNISHVTNYTMVLEDWTWHVVLPLLAYGATVGAALLLEARTVLALFLVGGTSVLLVFIGIHNAWDTVTHLTMQRIREQEPKKQKKTGK